MIRFGQAEAADPFAGRQLRQVFHALLFGAVGVDRVHDQRGLDAHRRAVAAVDPLDLARDQAVDDIAHAGAAVALRQRRAEQAEFAELGHDLPVEALVAERLQHPRLELLLAILPRRLLYQPLLLGELAVEQEGIVPLEGRMGVLRDLGDLARRQGNVSWRARFRKGGPDGARSGRRGAAGAVRGEFRFARPA